MVRFLSIFAIAAGLAMVLMPNAKAGWCGGANCGCGVVVVAQPCAPEMYLVNQGPVFSGPGHYLHQLADPPPCCYPYVGPSIPAIPTGNTVRAVIPAAFTVPMWDILTQRFLLHSTGRTYGDTGISIDRLAPGIIKRARPAACA